MRRLAYLDLAHDLARAGVYHRQLAGPARGDQQQLAAVEPPELEPAPEVVAIPESSEPPLAALEPWPPELESPPSEVVASDPMIEDDVLAALEPVPEDVEPDPPALELPSDPTETPLDWWNGKSPEGSSDAEENVA